MMLLATRKEQEGKPGEVSCGDPSARTQVENGENIK